MNDMIEQEIIGGGKRFPLLALLPFGINAELDIKTLTNITLSCNEIKELISREIIEQQSTSGDTFEDQEQLAPITKFFMFLIPDEYLLNHVVKFCVLLNAIMLITLYMIATSFESSNSPIVRRRVGVFSACGLQIVHSSNDPPSTTGHNKLITTAEFFRIVHNLKFSAYCAIIGLAFCAVFYIFQQPSGASSPTLSPTMTPTLTLLSKALLILLIAVLTICVVVGAACVMNKLAASC